MKVYVAGSFNHSSLCRMVAKVLRAVGHEIYLFCDPDTNAYKLSKNIRAIGDAKELTAKHALTHITVQSIYHENRMWLEWAEAVVVVLPSGRSAHLEAGWAKGMGRPVFVYGEMKQGEWDAMYCMLDGVFDLYELDDLLTAISTWRKDGKNKEDEGRRHSG